MFRAHSRPMIDPTVAQARTRPIVPVPTRRSDLIAGSRGPHVDTVIPPRANAVMMALRHRVNDGTSWAEWWSKACLITSDGGNDSHA
jgi:hypothetical protein